MNSPRTPPRFVPTLTEVVQQPLEIPALVPQDAGDTTTPVARQPSGELEEALVHRVMQRVDASLEHQLRNAIAQVVQEQTPSLVPRLREEVETVVRQAVYEAVADELAPVIYQPQADQD